MIMTESITPTMQKPSSNDDQLKARAKTAAGVSCFGAGLRYLR
jgi:hypothetical protein